MSKLKLFVSCVVFALFVVAALSCGTSNGAARNSKYGDSGSGKDGAQVETIESPLENLLPEHV